MPGQLVPGAMGGGQNLEQWEVSVSNLGKGLLDARGQVGALRVLLTNHGLLSLDLPQDLLKATTVQPLKLLKLGVGVRDSTSM